MTDVDTAIAGARDRTAKDRREHIQFLIASTQEGLDEEILAMLPDMPAYDRAPLCRILAERDPDRDPDYARKSFAGFERSRMGAWSDRRAFTFLAPMAWGFGFSRLRRLKPVERYTAECKRWSVGRRHQAVLALGDTADPAAVPLVLKALEDKSWRVRCAAAYSIRSLFNEGVVSTPEPAIDLLSQRLSDDRPLNVEAAAGALSDLGRTDLLIQARHRDLQPDARKIIDLALAGQVCAPFAYWPGHVGFDVKAVSVLRSGGRQP